MSESKTQSLLLLRAPSAIPKLRLFRRNVGAGKLDSGIFVRFNIKGQCDVFGLFQGGRHIELELKAKRSLSPEQEVWRDWCIQWGVPWLCLCAARGETDDQTVERWIFEIQKLK
jgi:hypothetical protein